MSKTVELENRITRLESAVRGAVDGLEVMQRHLVSLETKLDRLAALLGFMK